MAMAAGMTGREMREKNATLADVACAAAVSRTTAAKVLLGTGGDHVRISEGTYQRVTDAAAALRYRPNRSAQRLAGAPTQTFGVLMDTVNAPVMNDRLAAIEREASQRGYRLLIGQVHNRVSVLGDYLADFDSRGVDAIFCLFDLTVERNMRLFPVTGRRHDIVYHGMPLQPDGYCVRVDTSMAVESLVTHLLKTGRRRIGIELSNLNDRLILVRREAYCRTLAAHGLAVEEALMWTAAPGPEEEATEELAESVADTLAGRGRADAVISSNDIWAVRLIQALKRRRIRVPEDVAVTGYDNLELSTVIDPALTTIDQDHTAYARAALDLLTAAAAGSGAVQAGRTVTIAPHLVIRASSGAKAS
jgi:DNA-binding LacI/PurR family transcriptional regulator